MAPFEPTKFWERRPLAEVKQVDMADISFGSGVDGFMELLS